MGKKTREKVDIYSTSAFTVPLVFTIQSKHLRSVLLCKTVL